METVLASVILSLSTNLDNFAIGVAYSFKKSTISFRANFLIALLSGISTYLSMSLGDWLENFFLADWNRFLGSATLTLIGLLFVGKFIQEQTSSLEPTSTKMLFKPESPKQAMTLKEALGIGLALTVTNFGTGVGAGITQLDPELTSCFSFASSLLTIAGGSITGKLMLQFWGRRLELVSGLLLIGLGVYEYFF